MNYKRINEMEQNALQYTRRDAKKVSEELTKDLTPEQISEMARSGNHQQILDNTIASLTNSVISSLLKILK